MQERAHSGQLNRPPEGITGGQAAVSSRCPDVAAGNGAGNAQRLPSGPYSAPLAGAVT
jgi:hypothetical protein